MSPILPLDLDQVGQGPAPTISCAVNRTVVQQLFADLQRTFPGERRQWESISILVQMAFAVGRREQQEQDRADAAAYFTQQQGESG